MNIPKKCFSIIMGIISNVNDYLIGMAIDLYERIFLTSEEKKKVKHNLLKPEKQKKKKNRNI
jgi:hypothetical protein